jgi:ribulose 1,5-bisphosphate synthetase/thiazole synthase
MPLNVQPIASAEEIAEKQLRNSANAGQDWLKGVLNPSKDFREAGVKAKEKHKAETIKALNEDRYAKGLQAVNVEDVITTINKVGPQAYVAGIQARESQIRAGIAKRVPLMVEAKRVLDAMPNATDQDRLQKMIKNVELQKGLGAKLRG